VAALTEAVRAHQAGRLDAAAAGYRRVLAAQPKHPDALHLLGLLSHQRGDQDEAERLVAAALARSPRIAAFHNTLAAVLLAKNAPERAVAAAKRAATLDPKLASAHNVLGNALARLGNAEEAIASYRAALALAPDQPEALSNLGSALHGRGALLEAEAALRQALALRPDYAAAAANLALVLRDQGRFDDALAACDAALSLVPGQPTWRANRATLLLQLGRFAEGWDDYESRWQADGFTEARDRAPLPAWDGGDPSGRTILLQGEQGLGSMIQFARYAPVVAARGARVLLQAPRPLVRLFRHSFEPPHGAVDAIIEKGAPVPACDLQAPLMSLPRLCGTTLETIPADVPYLRADPASVAAWRQRLGDDGHRRVGLVWAGNPAHANDRNRSTPADALAPLVVGAPPDVRFVSLQVGSPPPPALLAAGLVDASPELADFAETAAAIMNLDLVISVDTAVAHLAGALAKPVWLLTPPIPEWRWLIDRDDSPWYPTMRLFRQDRPGDWAGVIDRVAAALLHR
jgi:Flp pilus assembly protein TadD, contains TPR repeats